MAEKRKSLLNSSLSINSIRGSVTNFSKSLRRSGVLASDIAKRTRQSNIFNQNIISKEDEYFRKRRENVRRKAREDELESSSVSGVTKKEGNIVSRSTKGFLGRILDFFGIILIGWFVNRLPEIIKAIRNVIKLIQKATGFLTGFLDGVKDFLTTMGSGIKNVIDSFPKFDFLQFKNDSEKTLKDTEDRAQKLNEEFQFGFMDYSKQINASYSDYPGIVENGEVVIPNDDGGQVEEGEISEDDGEETSETTDDSSLITAIRPEEEQDNLEIQENQGEEELIANLDKLNDSSKRLENVYDGKKNKVTKKVEEGMAGFGPGSSGGESGGSQTGGVASSGTSTSSNNNKFEASGFDDEDTSTDDSTSMGTPEAGDFYVTKGGQGNKQSFYHVLQPNGKIKSIGKRRPDGGSKFTRSQIVAAGNDLKSQNIKGVGTNDKMEIVSILSTDTSEENNSGLIEPIEKRFANLEKIFKDDRPTVIFKEIGFDNTNIQMPSISGELMSNINFTKPNDDLNKIHSLLLDSI